MTRTLVSLALALLLGVLIWFGLGVVAPDIYVEKAVVYLFYPAMVRVSSQRYCGDQGIVAPILQIRTHILQNASLSH
jgi:hypothetical protein